ncbi:MAG: XrtA-associated ATPase [Rhodospirillaceae bacterium]|nr:XrtA-associated ATPase [Rhodospirillaceae bacterium]
MYEKFFKFSEPPFQLTPDHRYFFASYGHKRAVGYLTFGLSQGEGFVVITGEVGAGKTTLVGHFLATLDPTKFVTSTVVTTQLGADDTLRLVAAGFGINQEGLDKATLLIRLQTFLKNASARGVRAVVIVDEAQNLSLQALEELRMLSNLQVARPPSLQLLLLGQPEFRDRMASNDLAQLRQRVIATYHLGPLSVDETRDYLIHRLRHAGWRDDPRVAADTFQAVFKETGGVPRLINVLFSRVLLFAYLEQRHDIDGKTVSEVAEDLRTEFNSWRPHPASGAA